MKILRRSAGEWLGGEIDGPPRYLVVAAADGEVILLSREPVEEDSDEAMQQESARILRQRHLAAKRLRPTVPEAGLTTGEGGA